MNADPPFTPPRRKLNIFWWIGGLFVLLLLLFLLQLFGPNPPIIVSRQTTFITEPLGPDGLPDYERYILESSREGVTPQNNAAVLLWQALFPGELDPEFFGVIAGELGLQEIPSKADALVSLHSRANREAVVSLLKRQAESQANGDPGSAAQINGNSTETPDGWDSAMLADWSNRDSAAVEEVIDRAMNRPWTSNELPPLAAWIQENKRALDLIVEASKRPRYYMPSPTLLNSDRDLLISMLLPHVQSVREVGRSLPARAMWHLGEGRADEAWQDLLALHRISNLLTQGNLLIEELVAIAMSGIACEATLTLVHQGQLTPEQARRVQRDLAAMPNFAVMARSLDRSERAMALNAFIGVATGGGGDLFSSFGGGQDDFGNNAFDIVSVDWNLVLRETNRWYDRLVAAASLPDRAARVAALAKVDAELLQIQGRMRSPGRLLAGVVSRQQRSQLVSGMMLSLFLPALNAVTAAEDRANTVLDLTRVAAAAAVYRADHGAYPQKLEDMVPVILERTPVDLYNVKPFIYQRTEDGFLLHSAGENGKDEGGSNALMRVLKGEPLDAETNGNTEKLESMIPAGADDYSIRASRQVFELPKVTPAPSEP